jgi:hypothetical protein
MIPHSVIDMMSLIMSTAMCGGRENSLNFNEVYPNAVRVCVCVRINCEFVEMGFINSCENDS